MPTEPRAARAPTQPRRDIPISERVAIVTGASSGIGEASARSLAERGFRVVLAARRGERLQDIAKDIEKGDGEALPVAVDLAEERATSELLARTLDAFGRVDVLVNNAGYSPAGAMEHVTRDTLRHVFEVNLFAGLQLISEVSPVMRQQGGGRILNMGSLAGSVAAPLAVPYAATKAAIEAATRGLRLELGQWNVRISLIVPGFVDTATFDNTKQDAERFRNDPDNPYRKTFFDLEEFAEQSLKNALAPRAIGELVAHAATVRRPRLRYYAPVSARMQSGFMGLLPEPLVDAILRRVYKLPSGS